MSKRSILLHRQNRLEVTLNLLYQRGIFFIGQIDLTGVHLEGTSVVGTGNVLGGQMEMKVSEFV